MITYGGGVHILTSKVASGWQGYDIKDHRISFTWTADQLRDETPDAWLLYNGKHESLPDTGPSDSDCPLTQGKTSSRTTEWYS